MKLESSYPVLMVEEVRTVADFYIEYFGFEETFAVDWNVSLRHSEQPQSELAFLDQRHRTIPTGFGVASRGVLINLEVDNAAGEHQRLVAERGLEPVLDPRDENFGQRHLIVSDPAGNLVDVIENIAASDEFVEAYQPQERES